MKNSLIIFSIDNTYSPLLANLLASLKKNSPSTVKESDIIIYHTGLLKNNIKALDCFFSNIKYININESSFIPNIFYNHPDCKKWGKHMFTKFNALKLLNDYQYVLWLDADLYINSDISLIFNTKEISFRKARTWNLDNIFPELKVKTFPGIASGVVLFTNKLIDYNISIDSLIDIYNHVKDIPVAAVDERMIAYLIYKKY